MSKRELYSGNEGYMEYESYPFTDKESKHTMVWYRLLPDLLEFYVQKLRKDVYEDIEWIEIRIGRDYGKDVYLYVAILLFRNKIILKNHID